MKIFKNNRPDKNEEYFPIIKTVQNPRPLLECEGGNAVYSINIINKLLKEKLNKWLNQKRL